MFTNWTSKLNWTAEDRLTSDEFNRINANLSRILNLLQVWEKPGRLPAEVPVYDRHFIAERATFAQPDINLQYLREHYYKPLGWTEPITDWTAKEYISAEDPIRWETNIESFRKQIEATIPEVQYCGTFSCNDISRLL